MLRTIAMEEDDGIPSQMTREKRPCMGNGDPFSNIPEEVREILEGEGRKLEGFEFVGGTPAFIVITYRVDYGGRPSFETPPSVVKFSKKKHSLADSTHIQLGSSRYYREYEGETEGVADPEEARLVQRGSLSEFLKKTGLSPQPRFENVSSTVTWARPDFLTFCTSIMAEGPGFRELESQFPDYDCATLIADPSAFALQLGKDIGRQFDMEEVQLSGIDILKQTMLTQAKITAEGRLPQKGLDTRVLVSHGPVSYCDPPEMIINRLPIASRGAAVPFVKRIKFAGHREYRFVVEFIGEPRKKVFLMEITDELRSLAHTLT